MSQNLTILHAQLGQEIFDAQEKVNRIEFAHNQMVCELTVTRVQRDELMGALKSIMEMLDDEIKTSTDEQLAFWLADPACPDHIKSELKCVIACRAAIAKAGGEA